MSDIILEVKNLNLKIKDENTVHDILNNVSFQLREKQRLGIIGGSGAGKSMTMYALSNLLPEKNIIIDGSICYYGVHDILKMKKKEKRKFCSENTAIILQDSINALNPYEKVYKQMEETVRFHHNMTKEQAREKIKEMMSIIGLDGDMEILNKYPDQFSGGMRQRIAITMALESNANILIADEPTTSLDAVNQKKLVSFIKQICRDRGLTLIFISHNLGLVSMLCENVLVMQNGEIIERGTVEEVFSHPAEPYTKALVNGTKELS